MTLSSGVPWVNALGGGGGGAPSTGVARVFQHGGGAKRGSEATERGKVWPPPTVYREIFFVVENSCMKTEFSYI